MSDLQRLTVSRAGSMIRIEITSPHPYVDLLPEMVVDLAEYLQRFVERPCPE
jgi:hypothetical protein